MNDPTLYDVHTSGGWRLITSDFDQAVTAVRTQLNKYGYPKTDDFLSELVATAGVLGNFPWFYGHVVIEYYR